MSCPCPEERRLAEPRRRGDDKEYVTVIFITIASIIIVTCHHSYLDTPLSFLLSFSFTGY